MTDFDDFRVVLTPILQQPGSWDVVLEECPVDGLAGKKGIAQAKITSAQLKRLRSRDDWPNEQWMREIGKSVWSSLMTNELAAAYAACWAKSAGAGRGLRLIVAMIGDEPDLPAGSVRLQELPVEALYSDGLSFIAPNTLSPISRSLHFKPDREAQAMSLPLRVLVVIATPQDKPPAKAADEEKAIRDALAQFSGPGGPVQLDFCSPPTRERLAQRLSEKKYHVLHFIGHGAFQVEGDDPTPRANLCFEDNDHLSDPVDARTLEISLRNSGIRLIIITACASAKPTADQVVETTGPFDGVAQALVAGVSGINAAVAMQFDIESKAAVIFSRTFYSQLLASECKLDEIVAHCRKEIITQLAAGHRAWVTPVVYWRCRGGKVFDIDPFKRAIDEETARQLVGLDGAIEIVKKHLAQARSQSDHVLAASAAEIARMQAMLDDLDQQRGLLLGETVRLRGGPVEAGKQIKCGLSVRLRSQARIGTVRISIKFQADKLTYVSSAAGGAGTVPFDAATAAGRRDFIFVDASKGADWAAEEFELAVLTFEVPAGVTDSVMDIEVESATVEKNGAAATAFEALDAVLFVSQPAPVAPPGG